MVEMFKPGESKSQAAASAAAARERTNEAIISFSDTSDNYFKELLKKELHLSWLKDDSDITIGQTYLALIMLAKKLFPPYKISTYDAAGNPVLDVDGKPQTVLINDVYSFWLTDFFGWLSLKRNVGGAQQKILRTDIGEHFLRSEEKTEKPKEE